MEAGEDIGKLIKQFYLIQEERIKVYSTFSSAHREYMATSPQYDFIKYRAQVNTVTEQFTALSRQVIDIIKLLRDNNAEAVAVLLEKLQATEKEKLEMTAQQQLLTQLATDQAAEGNEEKSVTEEKLLELKRSLAAVDSKMAELMEELKYESEDYLLII